MNLNSSKLKLVLVVSLGILFILLFTQYTRTRGPVPIYEPTHHSLSTSYPQAVTLYNRTDHKQRLPNAIIIGVRKAGTRALLNMLNLHPKVVTATQEVHYFNKEQHYSEGIQWYLNSMPLSYPDQLTIEKTPAYFVGEEVPLRMHSVLPNIKLLLIVRDPIERTVSDFAQLNSKKRERPDVKFEDLVLVRGSVAVNTKYSPIRVSLYHIHLERWLKYYPLSQIHIVDGDSIIENPVPELQKVERFLNVSSYFTQDMFVYNETKGFYCWRRHSKVQDEAVHCLGSGKGREHPEIADKTVNTLKTFFKEPNEQFYQLSHRRFNW